MNLYTYDVSDPDTKKQVKLPPLTCNFNHTSDTEYPKYKVDDIKNLNGMNYYFCDFPTHKDKLKWHTHTMEPCRNHKNWLEIKHDAATYPSNPKSTDKENVPIKYPIIT